MPPLVKKNCPTENSILKQTLITSDEFELVFSSSSRAMKVPSRAELSWGTSIFELKPS